MLLNRDRALAVMERYALDALVAALPENVYYLSGYGASHSFIFRNYGVSAAVLPRDDGVPPTLLVGEVDIPYLAAVPTWMPEVRMIGSFGSYVSPDLELTPREEEIRDLWAALRTRGLRSPNRQEVLAGVLRELGLAGKRLGIDDLRVTAELREAGVATGRAIDALNIFREIRLVKTSEEIALMRRAAQINDSCLEAASNLLVEARRRASSPGSGSRRWPSRARSARSSTRAASTGPGSSVTTPTGFATATTCCSTAAAPTGTSGQTSAAPAASASRRSACARCTLRPSTSTGGACRCSAPGCRPRRSSRRRSRQHGSTGWPTAGCR
jgi:hypothetical protein